MKLELFIILMIFLSQNNFSVSKTQKKRDDAEDDSSSLYSKCYDDLGCIETDARWYDKKLRPVNLKPLDRHIIKTDFLLIKRNKSDSQNLQYNSIMAKYSSIKSAGFHKKSSVLILIHDFTSNGYTGWVKHFSLIMLNKSSSTNIISVDWQRGAEPPYDQAISNARVVALEIIVFLRELKEKFSVSFNKIHLIGHGVGAHIAGYVGTTYNSVRKITGLDPSGPRFEGMPDIVKLNPTCARYVEIIHTDAFESRSQGTKEAIGHSDFYINNANLQPGCPENTTFPELISLDRDSLNEGDVLPGCSHKRAFKYFIEAVSDPHCVFLGIKCSSFEDFEKGRCTSCNKSDSTCRTFGLRSYKNSIQKTTFYLNSADHAPYCLFQYRITVFVKKDAKKFSGYFDFILVDDKADVAEAGLSDPIDIVSGVGNTFIYYAHPPKIGRIKEIKVRWNESKKFYCVIYCKQAINVEKVVVKFIGTGRNDEGHERSLCPVDKQTEIENGSYKTYTNCKKPSSPPASKTTCAFDKG